MDKKKSVEVWEALYADESWGARWPETELVRFFGLNFLKLPMKDRRELRILDIGVGIGNNSWFLLKEGFLNVYGVDISNTAISKFKGRLISEDIDVPDFDERFRVADIRDIPFDMEFDVIIDSAVLVCVSYTDHKKVMQKISELLKPGGFFYSWHILKGSWGGDSGESIDKDTIDNATEGPYKDKGTAYFADFEDYCSMVEANGLELVCAETLVRSYNFRSKFLHHAIVYGRKSKE